MYKISVHVCKMMLGLYLMPLPCDRSDILIVTFTLGVDVFPQGRI